MRVCAQTNLDEVGESALEGLRHVDTGDVEGKEGVVVGARGEGERDPHRVMTRVPRLHHKTTNNISTGHRTRIHEL